MSAELERADVDSGQMSVPANVAVRVRASNVLTITRLEDGVRGYIAIAGLEAEQLLDSFPPGSLAAIGTVGVLCGWAIVASLLCFIPGVRRLTARILPMDATSFPDAMALATVVALLVCSLIPTIVLSAASILRARR